MPPPNFGRSLVFQITLEQVKKNLAECEPNVLKIFCDEPHEYHFWKEDNKPEQITSITILSAKDMWNGPIIGNGLRLIR